MVYNIIRYLMYYVTMVVFVKRGCMLTVSLSTSTTLYRHCFTVSAVVTAFFMCAGYYIIIIVVIIIISYNIYRRIDKIILITIMYAATCPSTRLHHCAYTYTMMILLSLIK